MRKEMIDWVKAGITVSCPLWGWIPMMGAIAGVVEADFYLEWLRAGRRDYHLERVEDGTLNMTLIGSQLRLRSEPEENDPKLGSVDYTQSEIIGVLERSLVEVQSEQECPLTKVGDIRQKNGSLLITGYRLRCQGS